MFKKLILVIMLSAIMLTGVFAGQTVHQYGKMRVLVYEWTAIADGSIPAFETSAINGTVGWVQTDPGTIAPTANYDITLKNNDGYDIMGGTLANRSATGTEAITPYDAVNDIFITCPVRGPLTIAITGNSVDSATGTVTIFYWVY